MIFTTTAAIAFAALTGMQSVTPRVHPTVDVSPNYACEVSTFEFTSEIENLVMYEELKAAGQFPTKARAGKKGGVAPFVAAANTMYVKMLDYMYSDAEFEAKYMAYSTYYATNSYGEQIAGPQGSYVPEYDEFKFADDQGNRITFIYTDADHRYDFEQSENVFVLLNPGKGDPRVNALLKERFSSMLLKDVSYNKFFGVIEETANFTEGLQSTTDCILEAALGCEINDIGLETTFGPGSGGYSTNCWDWLYPIIDVIIYLHIIGYWEYTGIDLGAQINSINDAIVDDEVRLYDIEQGLETTFGPGSGGYSAMCSDAIVIADWIYNLILLLHLYGYLEYNGVDLGAQITAINNGIEDVKMAAAYVTGYNDFAIGILAGAGMNCALEMSDMMHGQYHLNQNVLVTNIANTSNMTFDQLVANYNN